MGQQSAVGNMRLLGEEGREVRRETYEVESKEKDGPEDGGERRRNFKYGHYDWQREIVG